MGHWRKLLESLDIFTSISEFLKEFIRNTAGYLRGSYYELLKHKVHIYTDGWEWNLGISLEDVQPALANI